MLRHMAISADRPSINSGRSSDILHEYMAIKRIFSAGGIILRPIRESQGEQVQDKSSRKSKWEVLVTQHSGHKGWDFPKGHREVYESEEQTALREVEEETGVKAEIIEKVGETRYFYFEEGERVLKTVTFYLMRYMGDGEATTAFEVSDKIWLPIDEVEERLTFKDTKALWEKAKTKIENLKLKVEN